MKKESYIKNLLLNLKAFVWCLIYSFGSLIHGVCHFLHAFGNDKFTGKLAGATSAFIKELHE